MSLGDVFDDQTGNSKDPTDTVATARTLGLKTCRQYLRTLPLLWKSTCFSTSVHLAQKLLCSTSTATSTSASTSGIRNSPQNSTGNSHSVESSTPTGPQLLLLPRARLSHDGWVSLFSVSRCVSLQSLKYTSTCCLAACCRHHGRIGTPYTTKYDHC